MTGHRRVLWLCKTRYMNHDVIDDRYARLFELPHCLGKSLDVHAFCLDYRLNKSAPVPADLAENWRRASIPGTIFIGWFFMLLSYVRCVKPQCVIASSDCLHVILGAFVSRLFGTTFYADLYDDYSTFGLARLPGMRWLYRRALSRADGICAVSRTLGRDIEKQYPGKPVLVLESTIDAELFGPRDRSESRRLLGLDPVEGKKLVGVCGGLNPFHGANIVFDAFQGISERHPDVLFVVAGRLYPDCPLPERDDIRFLGMLPHEQMTYFFSAMDVVVVPLSNTQFGYYAFPQKAYEVLACRVPVAAADVGALSLLFEGLPDARYAPDSSTSLAETVARQLRAPALLYVDIPTWDDQADALSDFLQNTGPE
ncbi:MAG: teichuronic acid biosynthesis glycosyltransferase TuaC [Desulforhopalus sp.]|jgi:teichuronic acid biosynthesis glycosyltransferase TuaC